MTDAILVPVVNEQGAPVGYDAPITPEIQAQILAPVMERIESIRTSTDTLLIEMGKRIADLEQQMREHYHGMKATGGHLTTAASWDCVSNGHAHPAPVAVECVFEGQTPNGRPWGHVMAERPLSGLYIRAATADDFGVGERKAPAPVAADRARTYGDTKTGAVLTPATVAAVAAPNGTMPSDVMEMPAGKMTLAARPGITVTSDPGFAGLMSAAVEQYKRRAETQTDQPAGDDASVEYYLDEAEGLIKTRPVPPDPRDAQIADLRAKLAECEAANVTLDAANRKMFDQIQDITRSRDMQRAATATVVAERDSLAARVAELEAQQQAAASAAPRQSPC